jgi:glycosyltransferase involved in cell wall biosynthesis
MHRILHVVPSLAASGTTRQLALLAGGLPRSAFEIHVAAIDDAATHVSCGFQKLGVEAFVAGRRWPIDPVAFGLLHRHMKNLRPALVHTWLFSANTYGRLAALAAGVRRIIATQRHIDSWKLPHELAIDRWLAARSARIVANSTSVRDFYVKRGLPPECISVIPVGVAKPEAASISRQNLLTQLGLPGDSKLVACLGSLVVRKRIKELIWAADQLKAVGTTAHLLVIGDGPLRPRLERYTRQNRVEDRVHFLGRRDDARAWLPHIDVLWQASATDGQSSAILEAMAAGIPVVAADAPGNRELVVPGETGYLVPCDQRAGFARHTLPLIEDPELARRLGSAGQRLVLEQHRAEDYVERHARLYRELLA